MKYKKEKRENVCNKKTTEVQQLTEAITDSFEINDKNKNSLSDSSANYNKNINNVNYDRKSKFVREKEGMKREVSGERIKETKASKREVGNMRELNSSRFWEEKASKMGRKIGHDSGKKFLDKFKGKFENPVANSFY